MASTTQSIAQIVEWVEAGKRILAKAKKRLFRRPNFAEVEADYLALGERMLHGAAENTEHAPFMFMAAGRSAAAQIEGVSDDDLQSLFKHVSSCYDKIFFHPSSASGSASAAPPPSSSSTTTSSASSSSTISGSGIGTTTDAANTNAMNTTTTTISSTTGEGAREAEAEDAESDLLSSVPSMSISSVLIFGPGCNEATIRAIRANPDNMERLRRACAHECKAARILAERHLVIAMPHAEAMYQQAISCFLTAAACLALSADSAWMEAVAVVVEAAETAEAVARYADAQKIYALVLRQLNTRQSQSMTAYVRMKHDECLAASHLCPSPASNS
jgi:hypothetical protein